ncbi:GNAT family N-acetyltransferase [Streptomyces goshikiensis]|uniref:GNAT family N-acetyltransferase n=1 Tax=Streptomyces goshikiensis TaxID=1942 RepID=A0ABZ1RJC8_9ACTN|nr:MULTISPECIES: GNAT family N-acetyltransferase [Streptomyces]AKL67818.1 acetyltransferase [Streptomyces sp. Mg1]EDX24518.1 acetyltransferase [Streptomyces sp. Mg1]MBP0936234.1 GNAT family N-acetyltransferase [Streptomyces sp. KCTC 0041BP]OKI29435.1 acetyltransferase [Streptomyces sp. CB03578]PJN14377.1 N-acetyltransferase [Streptomyces sp. CB02120-2]
MVLEIRQADQSDRDAVARLLDVAFRDDPVSGWVFPDPEHRAAVHGKFLGVFVDVALEEGRIDCAVDGSAAALWLRVPAGDPDAEAAEDEVPARMRAAADPDNERCELVGRLTGAVHPTAEEHEYLLMIAVAPGRQGEGLGTELMRPVLERCDREGLPAYLEASSERSKVLYERLGWEVTGEPVRLPDGPLMWPMWRKPRG